MPISFQWFHKTFNISTNNRKVGFHDKKKEVKIWIIYIYTYIYIYIYTYTYICMFLKKTHVKTSNKNGLDIFHFD